MEYISYCGLLCNECPVFIATAENNEKLKEQLAVVRHIDIVFKSKLNSLQ
jgi:hypothetical protein